MADQVVDEDRASADSQCFGGELLQLAWVQMVRKQSTAHEFETRIAEGKSKSVCDQRAMLRSQVRGNTIQICDIERNSVASELLRCGSRHLTESRRYFQK